MGHIRSKETNEQRNQQKNISLPPSQSRAPAAADQSTLCEQTEKSVRVSDSGMIDAQGENDISHCLITI